MRYSGSNKRIPVRCIFRMLAPLTLACCILPAGYGQRVEGDAPVVVRPGAPGEPTRILPASTRAKLPHTSAKDIDFMRGMIMHHAQAVEMAAMIESRTQNRDIRLLGERISKSQLDEMEFMKTWLEARGHLGPTTHVVDRRDNMHAHSNNAGGHTLMPGMLTPKQMDELRKAKDAEFDRLFLRGMIQHHAGALVMVKELFNTPGAGQDAELFSFASDVDTGQRAEIRSMQTLLGEKP